MRIAAQSTPLPMIEMNTTPLIDVMLVLLIMLIITIPPQTHAVKLDLPVPTPLPVPPPDPIKNILVVTRGGTLVWNGSPMSMAMVRQELRATQQMNPTPELHLRPDPDARYGTVDELLGLIKREHVEKVGFEGNERFVA
jgi:biopolymer transport protein ExbD